MPALNVVYRAPPAVAAPPPQSTSPPVPASKANDVVFVINPKGGNGRTLEQWRKLAPSVRGLLPNHNVREVLTKGPMDAADITAQALADGTGTVVAVGGDGTLHEVVNGFFRNKKTSDADSNSERRTALAVLPLGTGCDFARTYGWSKDGKEALRRIARGRRQPLDVGRVQCQGSGGSKQERYFVNIADVAFSANVGLLASSMKAWGPLCYTAATLRAFTTHRNSDLKVRVNDGPWQRLPQTTMVAIANAQFFGGGMRIGAGADTKDGLLDVVCLQEYKWWDFVSRGAKLFSGTHLAERGVSSQRVRRLDMEDDWQDQPDKKSSHMELSKTLVQADGEHLGMLPASFKIIPAAIDLIT